jgi:hypothetical protein
VAGVRVQILGSTRLARAVLPYVFERRQGRVLALDPGQEDEGLPWFAPVRGLARDNGVPLGRAGDHPATVVLDCDPDARPDDPEGVALRVLAPPGARSADLNRMLLEGGAWQVAVTDGRQVWATRTVEAQEDDDAEDLMARATLRALEALDDAWEPLVSGASGRPLERPLLRGRWRAQESQLTWEQPADRIVARIRACAGPYGGARAYLGETAIRVMDARVTRHDTPEEWAPGTIVSLEGGMTVSTGRGLVTIRKVRPAWRPIRDAVDLAAECGIGAGYLLA